VSYTFLSVFNIHNPHANYVFFAFLTQTKIVSNNAMNIRLYFTISQIQFALRKENRRYTAETVKKIAGLFSQTIVKIEVECEI